MSHNCLHCAILEAISEHAQGEPMSSKELINALALVAADLIAPIPLEPVREASVIHLLRQTSKYIAEAANRKIDVIAVPVH